jgi:hypothetical protein
MAMGALVQSRWREPPAEREQRGPPGDGDRSMHDRRRSGAAWRRRPGAAEARQVVVGSSWEALAGSSEGVSRQRPGSAIREKWEKID